MIFGYVTGGMLFHQVMSACTVTFAMLYDGDSRKKLIKACIAIIVVHSIILFQNNSFVSVTNWTTALQVPFVFCGTFLFICYVFSETNLWSKFYVTVWGYLISNITAQLLSVILTLGGSYPSEEDLKTLISFVFGSILCCVILYFFVQKILYVKISVDGKYPFRKQKFILTIAVIIFYFIFSNYQFLFWLMNNEPKGVSNMISVFRLVTGGFCLVVLYLQSSDESLSAIEQERDMMAALYEQQKEQYRLSRENIDIINRKCHDLKYQIAALKNLSSQSEANAQITEMERAIMIYDSSIKTNNDVLDTVLMEKLLFCEANGINMTVMADGSILSFINQVDLYTMFANSIDNAIESVIKQQDRSRRIIQVSVFKERNMAIIRIRNYCDTQVIFEDGLPVTSKKYERGYHGFGTRSIRHTAEKYGGGMVCDQSGMSFVVRIMLPIPIVLQE